MNTQLVYFTDKDEDEAILIDTTGSTKSELEESYCMKVKDIVEIDADLHEWPTDRLMFQNP